MEKNGNHEINQKLKGKIKIKKKYKGNNIKIEDKTQENIPQQNMIINGEVIISPNKPNQKGNMYNLPLQDSTSEYRVQPQKEVGIPQYIRNNNQPIDYKIKVRSKPIKVRCPYCGKIALTEVEDECNFVSLFIYMLMFIIFPLFVIWTFCFDFEECICEFGCKESREGCCCIPTCCVCPSRGTLDDCKCCFNVNHYCSNCGKFIGTRNACSSICPPCCNC